MSRDPGLLSRHLRIAHTADVAEDVVARAASAGLDALEALHARAHGYTRCAPDRDECTDQTPCAPCPPRDEQLDPTPCDDPIGHG